MIGLEINIWTLALNFSVGVPMRGDSWSNWLWSWHFNGMFRYASARLLGCRVIVEW